MMALYWVAGILVAVCVALFALGQYRMSPGPLFPLCSDLPLPNPPSKSVTQSPTVINFSKLGNRYLPHIFLSPILSIAALCVGVYFVTVLSSDLKTPEVILGCILMFVVSGVAGFWMWRMLIARRLENSEEGSRLLVNADCLEVGRGLVVRGDEELFKTNQSASLKLRWEEIIDFRVEPWRRMAPPCYEIRSKSLNSKVYVWRKPLRDREQIFINAVGSYLKCPLVINRS